MITMADNSLLDRIPTSLKEGENWELLQLDPHWVWTAEHEDQVVGVLIASPCHGMVFIWRLKVAQDAPPWTLGRLLRRFIRDLRKRGCIGYMTFLMLAEGSNEQALFRIATRAGAMFTTAQTLVIGSVNAKHVGEG